MVIGVCGPVLRVTTKSALYWVGALARGAIVSSAGTVNAGGRETKANKPGDISLFMVRSYYDPASAARSKKRSSRSCRSSRMGARSQNPGVRGTWAATQSGHREE